MAVERMVIDGYGQVELNNAAFRRDGRIEAQCRPESGSGEDFEVNCVENGMLLAVDPIKHTVRIPTEDDTLIALVYSAEHIYDERTPGLKNFKLNGKNDFLPRLGYLSVGDKFRTNCVEWDVSTYEDYDAVKEAVEGGTDLYGGISADGAILISATEPTQGPVLQVALCGTMPDGQPAFKFICIKA